MEGKQLSGLLSSLADKIERQVNLELENIQSQRKELEEKKKKWSESQSGESEKIRFPSKIKLDIGGMHFTTSLNTLTLIGGTFFTGMFSGKMDVQPGKDGSYFIDRDPTAFPYILNFLRGIVPDTKTISKLDLSLLKQDAVYYEIDDLVEFLIQQVPKLECVWSPRGSCASRCVIGKNGTTLSMPGGGWCSCQFGVGPLPDSGVVEATIQWTDAHEGMFAIVEQNWDFRLDHYPGSGYYEVTRKDSPGENSISFYRQFVANCIVRTVVDMDQKNITFYLNDVQQGVTNSFASWNTPVVLMSCLRATATISIVQ